MTNSKCFNTGKVRYIDQAAAQSAEDRLNHSHKVAPYRCPECEGWHLGGHHRQRKGDTLAQFGGPRHE